MRKEAQLAALWYALKERFIRRDIIAIDRIAAGECGEAIATLQGAEFEFAYFENKFREVVMNRPMGNAARSAPNKGSRKAGVTGRRDGQ